VDVDPAPGKAVRNGVTALESSAEQCCSGTSLGFFVQKLGVCLWNGECDEVRRYCQCWRTPDIHAGNTEMDT